MTYPLTNDEHKAIERMSADDRYDYLVEKVVENGELWSLNSDEGWVEMTSHDGEECLPLWPHPDLAKEWATGEWADCVPAAIPLDVWIDRWTPGLEHDGTLLAVFPGRDEDGVIVTPDDLLASMEALLDQ